MTDAVVLPGGGYGVTTGMLLYAGNVADQRGASVHRHSWTETPPDPHGPLIEDWVRAQVTPVLDRVGGRPLLIGKSLGTLAAPVAADRGLPAVWLTPLLVRPGVVDALARASAPFLLVGGTADPLWDAGAARRLTPHVLEVVGADHGMYVPGPLVDTIGVLARIVVAMEEFLDGIGWPG